MDRKNIEKIAHTSEDRYLLSKLYDKINAGINKNVMANTCFLSQREQEMARYLFGDIEGLYYFGGYEDSERRILIYLPDYFTEDIMYEEESPVTCIRAKFYENDELSHRDFLGALMGSGIERDCVGDILVGKGSCDFFITREMTNYIMQNFISAGRTKLSLTEIEIKEASVPKAEVKEIKDTLASLRLDAVISSGFRVGRNLASQYIEGGKVQINGLPTEKPDKQVTEGAKISVRGLGKILLREVKGQTKKGRISVIIERYI